MLCRKIVKENCLKEKVFTYISDKLKENRNVNISLRPLESRFFIFHRNTESLSLCYAGWISLHTEWWILVTYCRGPRAIMRGPLRGLRINHFGLLLRDQSLILLRLFLHFLEVFNPRWVFLSKSSFDFFGKSFLRRWIIAQNFKIILLTYLPQIFYVIGDVGKKNILRLFSWRYKIKNKNVLVILSWNV